MSDDSKLTPWERRFKIRFERKMAVVRPSWPDFLCVEDGKLVLVEVKGGNDWVSKNQRFTFDILMHHGIDVHIWHASFYRQLFKWRDVRRIWCGRDYRSEPVAWYLRPQEQGDSEEAPEEGGDTV